MSLLDWIIDYWDMFLARLFRDWGGRGDATYMSPGQAVTRRQGQNIAARVDAKLAEQRAAKSAPVAGEAAEQDVDFRPQPVPQDLDALTNGVAPPPATPDRLPQIDAELKVTFDPDWCTCEGLEHNAKCGFAAADLSIGSLLPPPPSPSPYAAAPTEPSPSQP